MATASNCNITEGVGRGMEVADLGVEGRGVEVEALIIRAVSGLQPTLGQVSNRVWQNIKGMSLIVARE